MLARGGVDSGASPVVFTAPSGIVTVVRHITIATFAVGATTWTVGVPDVALLAAGLTLGIGSDAQRPGRWVLDEGDEVQVSASGGDISYYISGYQFTS